MTTQTKLIKPNFSGKIGFEIECVYKNENYDEVRDLYLKNGWTKTGDGSIRTSSVYNEEAEIKFNYDLVELKKMLPEIKKLLSLVKSGQDYNCGLHIHLSFDEICNYYKLSCWNFIKYFQDSYKEYAKTPEEKARIRNSYCKYYPNKDDFIEATMRQLSSMQKNERYWCVNFNSYNIHQTIEFRIFNGTDNYNKFVDNINFLFKTINEFLSEQKEISFGLVKDTPQKQKARVIRKYIGENNGN